MSNLRTEKRLRNYSKVEYNRAQTRRKKTEDEAASLAQRERLLRVSGTLRLLIGCVMALFGLGTDALVLLNRVLQTMDTSNYNRQLWLLLAIGLLGVLLARSGVKKFRLHKLYRSVSLLVQQTPETTVAALSRQLGKNEKQFKKQLLIIMKRSLLPGSYMDIKTNEIKSMARFYAEEKERVMEYERAIKEKPEDCERVPCPVCEYENLVPEGKIGVCVRCGAPI